MVHLHSFVFVALTFWYSREIVSRVFITFVQEIHNIC